MIEVTQFKEIEDKIPEIFSTFEKRVENILNALIEEFNKKVIELKDEPIDDKPLDISLQDKRITITISDKDFVDKLTPLEADLFKDKDFQVGELLKIILVKAGYEFCTFNRINCKFEKLPKNVTKREISEKELFKRTQCSEISFKTEK